MTARPMTSSSQTGGPNWLASSKALRPAAIIFVSANIANVTNLLFNMIFARLLGPVLFADLTLLLTLKLGALAFLCAIQFAFSEYVAKAKHKSASKRFSASMSQDSLYMSIPVMLLILILTPEIGRMLNLGSYTALFILFLALPFFVPMVIYRGLAQGLIDIPKIVTSIQSEWIIRLFGSLLLWHMGFGLAGIMVAISFSIFAGFIFSTDKKDWRLMRQRQRSKPKRLNQLMVTSLPYITLQLFLITSMDSDIILAKAHMSAEIAGLVAGLLLVQRIFFFAFSSFSGVLQPIIARHTDQRSALKELLLMIIGIATATTLGMALFVPLSDQVTTFLLGADYLAIAPLIPIAGLIGAIMMISYLCAIFLIMRGEKFVTLLMFSFGVAQILYLAALAPEISSIGLERFFIVKLVIQSLCTLFMIGWAVYIGYHPRPELSISDPHYESHAP